MGLFDDISSKVLGKSGPQDNLLPAIMALLSDEKTGGLAGLVQKFSGKGLGDIVSSWTGTGAPLPITPQQVQQGFGGDTINQLASKAGLSTDQVTSKLSEILPGLVSKLTPDGVIPKGDLMAKGMDLLKGMIK